MSDSVCLVTLSPTPIANLLVLPESVSVAPLDIPKKVFLQDQYFVLPGGCVFIDKKIPSLYDKPFDLPSNVQFSSEHFVNLHELVKS